MALGMRARNWYTDSFVPVVLGDFGCDVTCQACRANFALSSKPLL